VFDEAQEAIVQRIDRCRDILHQLLSENALLMNKAGRIASNVIVSEDRNHFMVINESWKGKRRIHSLVFHAEFRSGKPG
jgi:hypothetical protein